jgi:small subunit ribosomal protein S4
MRRTRSDYERQLRMKQKAKRAYGVLEGQFRTYYQRAAHKEGVTGDLLMQQLEMRLDNVVYRLGLAPSRSAARQLVRHRHIDVNDRIVNVPSYQLRKGDTVKVRQKSRELERIHLSLQRAIRGRDVPWLEIDKVGLAGHVLDVPAREVIPTPVEEQLIIELYSK